LRGSERFRACSTTRCCVAAPYVKSRFVTRTARSRSAADAADAADALAAVSAEESMVE
jgi:hypothetical protein